MQKRYLVLVTLSIMLITLSLVIYNRSTQPHIYQLLEQKKSTTKDIGHIGKEHLIYITEKIGRRLFGSEAELETAYYLKDTAEQLGYGVKLQYFEGDRVPSSSYNVIVTKAGKSKEKIIVGAHFDTMHGAISPDYWKDAKGVIDNGGSVAALLEVLYWLQDIETPYTIEFVFFAGEEFRVQGSSAYVKNLTPEEQNNIVFMMNLDAIFGKEYNYIHNGSNKVAAGYRKTMIKLANALELPFKIQEGKNDLYEAGTTTTYSDHVPFDAAGIPIIMLEAANFEIPSYDNYVLEPLKNGERMQISHSRYDNIAFIEEQMPGHIDKNLNTFVTMVLEILLHPNW